MQRINLSETRVTPEVLGIVPVSVARIYHILPIRLSDLPGENGRPLEVVVKDNITTDFWAEQYQDELDFVLSRRVIPAYVAPPKEIRDAIKQWYG